MAQRLVRNICPDCRVEVRVSEDQRRILAQELGVKPEDVLPSYYRGQGCKECAGTGYRGRSGIFEFLPMTDSVQREVLRGADRERIFRQAVSEGMVSLRMSGLEKVKLGKTTYEEVLRVTR